MINQDKLESIMFFDIETVSEHKDLDDYKGDIGLRKQLLWKKKAEQLRGRQEDLQELSDRELYERKAGLFPEFAKVACIAFGLIEFSEPDKKTFEVKHDFSISSYVGEELDILTKTKNTFSKFQKAAINARFCGHNIKRFDVPFLGRRWIINGVNPPSAFNLIDKKPWELPFLDSSEVWSFGNYQDTFTSLDLILTSLNLPSSKTILNNDEVTRTYWQENDIDKIQRYCEADVEAVMSMFIKFSNLQS